MWFLYLLEFESEHELGIAFYWGDYDTDNQ